MLYSLLSSQNQSKPVQPQHALHLSGGGGSKSHVAAGKDWELTLTRCICVTLDASQTPCSSVSAVDGGRGDLMLPQQVCSFARPIAVQVQALEEELSSFAATAQLKGQSCHLFPSFSQSYPYLSCRPVGNSGNTRTP